MTRYTDGFVIPVPKAKLEAYRAQAETAGRIWREYGALDYKECVLEHTPEGCGLSFPQGIQAKPDETVVFSWISYESREHRDAVNKRVLEDPRICAMCENGTPFDVSRMLYSGFAVIVDAFADQAAGV